MILLHNILTNITNLRGIKSKQFTSVYFGNGIVKTPFIINAEKTKYIYINRQLNSPVLHKFLFLRLQFLLLLLNFELFLWDCGNQSIILNVFGHVSWWLMKTDRQKRWKTIFRMSQILVYLGGKWQKPACNHRVRKFFK